MIPLSHDCYDDTHCNDLKVLSDCSSPFASLLDTSTSLDTFEDVPIFPNPYLPLAPLGEFKEGDGFGTNASSDSQCGILVESEDTFSKEHPLYEPCDVEFSEVSPYIELIDPFSDECSSNLVPAPPISSLSSSLPNLPSSLDPLESAFVDSEIFVLVSPC